MIPVLRKKWKDRAKEQGLDPNQFGAHIKGIDMMEAALKYGSKVIVDDVLLYADSVPLLLKYFEIVLSVLQEHCATIKLKKCKFLLPSLEFVGVDILPTGNAPAASKFDAFRMLPRPNTWTDLRMLIGMFGFYQQWLERYEARIQPFRKLQKGAPKPGMLSQSEEMDFFSGFWLPSHQSLFEELRSQILSAPVLAR